MTTSQILRSNFTGGEISPLLECRGDLVAVRNGCRTAENVWVLPYGGITKREGLLFVARAKYPDKKCRLVKFEYSITQTYILEFGNNYIRFFANGGQIVSSGLPYEIASPYLEAQVAGLQFAQSADVLFIVHGSHPPKRLKRLGHTNWKLEDIPFAYPAFGPEPPVDEAANIRASAVTGTVTLTATAAVFDGAKHVGAAIQLRELPRGNHEAWEVQRRQKNGAGAIWPYTQGQMITYEGRVYQVTGLGSEPEAGASGAKPPVHESGSASDGNLTLRFVNYGRGWAQITQVTSATSARATVKLELPEVVASGGTKMWALGAWGPAGYPVAVHLHQGRFVLAGAALSPDRVYASAIDGWLTFRLGTLDDEAFEAGVVGSNVQAVRSLQSMGAKMIVATASGVWSLSPGPNKAYLAPAAIVSSFDIGSLGCAAGQPVIRINQESIVLHRSRKSLHALQWAIDIDGLSQREITIIAVHIGEAGLSEIAYQQEASPAIWAVRDDGQMAVCTYMPEQEVIAWTRYVTDGQFRSVAILPAEGDDEVWVAVQRSSGWTIERFAVPFGGSTDQADAVFVDSALKYSGPPATVFSGLSHLIGKEVAILADGRVMPRQVVSAAGSVTLPSAYSRVTVGLPYVSLVELTDPDVGAPDGSTRGRHKRHARVALDMYRSSEIEVGASPDGTVPIEMSPSPRVFGEPVPLTTGERRGEFAGEWSYENRIVLRHDLPLSFTVRGVVTKFSVAER